MSLRSAVFQGWVHHRRPAHGPAATAPGPAHEFKLDLSLLYLELDELERAFAGRWLWSGRRRNVAWFDRRDYLGDPAVPLDEAVRDLVEERLGARPAGPIGVLTQLRTLGFCFNPVSFYYCWDPAGARLEAIVAEIENTPWGERHAYVLRPDADEARFRRPEAPSGVLGRPSASPGLGVADRLAGLGPAGDPLPGASFRFPKEFHVSPFLPMGLVYDWRFVGPALAAGDPLVIHMQARDPETDALRLETTFSAVRRELSGASLARVLVARPLGSLTGFAAIYWNAARLWWKGAPFFSHPRHALTEAR